MDEINRKLDAIAESLKGENKSVQLAVALITEMFSAVRLPLADGARACEIIASGANAVIEAKSGNSSGRIH